MKTLYIFLLMTLTSSTLAQINRIDIIRPDAPELAAHGEHDTGVRTLQISLADRPDILNARQGEPTPLYTRELTIEVWYPAALTAEQVPGTEYATITRNPQITATLHGRAVRDAEPARETSFPLVIISHGHPGNRYLLSHLGENLASKGYVVVSIDHKDSTYDDQQNFNSTLYNRSYDQRLVLDSMAAFSADATHFLHGVVDADNTAIVGYSMGGFGAVNNMGAGYSDAGVGFIGAPPNRQLHELAASNPQFRSTLDPRIKAGIPIAPWGMQMGFWDAEGLTGLTVPALFVAGDADATSGYDNGVKALYDGAVNSDRYLLVFKNAGHSVAAPIPLPVEFLTAENPQGAAHYTDPVWDNVRMNNILQHFATAFLDLHLKGDTDKRRYLELPEDGAEAGPDGWTGFSGLDAVGLKLYHN
ncbi:alpha/beta hydrolase family protein [Pseudohongiella spirulinae]|uniref:Putative dienelactone hydrolase n=1 Tax=Pseudohongiella spirulinae TaxID=1249552 RepID=A0A0S2K9I3_9GAMM|nr:alpha/beta fold hydrolase [Pseudohongiella spirulinae]ALO45008.1 putative dienelactone hydrolase [Pseudohongiella spirulinae]